MQDPSPGKEVPKVPTPSKKENALSILSSGTKGTSNPAGHSWSQRGPRGQQNNGKQGSWTAFFFHNSRLLSGELRTPRSSMLLFTHCCLKVSQHVFCSSRSSWLKGGGGHRQRKILTICGADQPHRVAYALLHLPLWL